MDRIESLPWQRTRKTGRRDLGRVKKKFLYIYTYRRRVTSPSYTQVAPGPRGRKPTICGLVSRGYLETINQRMACEKSAPREKYDAEPFLSVAPGRKL